MLLVIVTFIVAMKAQELRTVIKIAIILPLATGLLLGLIMGTEHLASVIITVPLHLIVGFGAFKYFQHKRKKRSANAASHMPNEVQQTIMKAATDLIEIDNQRRDANDVMAAHNTMAQLCAFVGTMRDAHAVRYKPDSFAAKYAHELECKNYGYVYDAQDYIVAALKNGLSANNFSTVLMGFLTAPEPAFKRQREKNWVVEEAKSPGIAARALETSF